jgi:signal recognition particle receptor subunit alpha
MALPEAPRGSLDWRSPSTSLVTPMLDLFTVLTSGGIVLFQRSQASSSSAPVYLVDRLISDVFMQGRSSNKEYAKDGYTVKWTFVNELELIFVAAYQKMLELTWVDELLSAVKRMFVKSYADSLKRGDTTAVISDLNGVECHFGTWFEGKVQSYEGARVCLLYVIDEGW